MALFEQTLEQNLYAEIQAQRVLEKAAALEVMQWWEDLNSLTHNPRQLAQLMADPFAAVVQTYGQQAAAQAVDYLILRRSLDEYMLNLPTPVMADLPGEEQIHASLRWAITSSIDYGNFDSDKAAAKLRGITNRLVLKAGRDTVYQTTVRDGTLYARVPEPGACWFCLMLASRGAVYTRKTVLSVVSDAGKQASGDRFHDHCRCIGIEVNPKRGNADLPQVNQDLYNLWQQHVGIASHPGITSEKQIKKWQSIITGLKEQAQIPQLLKTPYDQLTTKQQQLLERLLQRRFPAIPGIKTPQYETGQPLTLKRPGSDEHLQIQLPSLDTMPGHVLHGWIHNVPVPITRYGTNMKRWRFLHLTQIQQGHTAKSIRNDSTVFPEHWTDQKIVDAMAQTFEHPERYQISPTRDRDKYAITVYKTVDNVVIKGIWQFDLQGNPVAPPYGFPYFGENVKVIRNQRPVPLTEAQIRARMDNYEAANQYQPLL